jgi:DNA repair/transcription protein MET18/MMS19
MPFLIQRFLHPENQASRQAILTCFGQVFHALEKAEDVANLLAPYKDQLLAAMTIGLKETSSRESAISAMLHAVKLAGLLTAEELRFAVHVVNDVTFADSGNESSW